MTKDLLSICYEGEAGVSNIRTLNVDDILYLSLSDILETINRENKELDEKSPKSSLLALVRGQMDIIESDEMLMVPVSGDSQEVFVTEPGLYRVMASNKSKAGKKFQRWLFHDVIPSIVKFGVYPPPKSELEEKSSNLSKMAEVLATNSRLLADSIAEQERLKENVNVICDTLGSLDVRVEALENRTDPKSGLLTVAEYFEKHGVVANGELVLAWCENITLNECREMQRSACGNRDKSRFEESVLDKAYNYTIS